jgi:hypothetical protein
MKYKNRNYIDGKWGFGVANKWLLWYLPLFLIVTLAPTALGYDELGNYMAVGMIIVLLGLDLYSRIFKSKKNLLDGLTFPDEGYILHLFILPLPVWIACVMVLMSIISVYGIT